MSIQVNKFISSSDLATFKNDTSGTVFTVVIPSGLVYNPSSPIIGRDSKVVGKINSGLRCVGQTSKYPGVSVGSQLISDLAVNISGVGNSTTTLYCSIVRTSDDTLELQVGTEGVIGSPNYTTTETQTITFVVSTYLSPFDS